MSEALLVALAYAAGLAASLWSMGPATRRGGPLARLAVWLPLLGWHFGGALDATLFVRAVRERPEPGDLFFATVGTPVLLLGWTLLCQLPALCAPRHAPHSVSRIDPYRSVPGRLLAALLTILGVAYAWPGWH